MSESNKDFLLQFIEIINTLRVALTKDKEKKHLVESIHWIRDLKVLFPGKEHIFDWFPKYFQRELRDKLEGQCHIKFTGDGQKRQLVISRDSEIQKNHFCSFKNLNELAIKFPVPIKLPLPVPLTAPYVIPAGNKIVVEAIEYDVTRTEKRRCNGKFEIDILELFIRKSTLSLYRVFLDEFLLL
jgi:hypothetical protein